MSSLIISSRLLLSLLLLVGFCLSLEPPPFPDYASLDTMESSKLHLEPTFQKACKEMAGYYSDPHKDPRLKKTILIGAINNAYREFYHNYKCFMDLFGIKFLTLALDSDVYQYLKEKNVPTHLMADIEGRPVGKTAMRFGSDGFNLIGCRKMEAVLAALRLGYDVIFSDMDIVYFKDPIKYLFFPDVDYVHSENKGCNVKWNFNETMEGNTGFYAVKSNEKTIRTWDLTFKLCSISPKYDDQTMFWKIARTNHNPSPAPLEACPKVETSLYSANPAAEVSKSQSKIISCPLDNCMFAAKHLKDSTLYHIWQKDLKRRNQQPVMVHANWISGKDAKKLAMQVHGLWIAKPVPISGPLPNRLLLTNSNHTEVSRDLQAKPSPMIRQSQGVAVGKAVGGRAGANSNDAFTKVAMRKTVKRAPHMPNSGFNEGIQHTGNWTCIKPTNSNVSIK